MAELKYKLVGHTNPYIADRDALFKGKCHIDIELGLSLREAQLKILEWFNEDFNTHYSNWGLVRINHGEAFSYTDGCRGYAYDSRYFEIEIDASEPEIF